MERNRKIIMNGEGEKIWKGALFVIFRVILPALHYR